MAMGTVIFFPCDAEQSVRVDLETDECKLIGPKFMEGMNKWQNGFLAKRWSNIRHSPESTWYIKGNTIKRPKKCGGKCRILVFSQHEQQRNR